MIRSFGSAIDTDSIHRHRRKEEKRDQEKYNLERIVSHSTLDHNRNIEHPANNIEDEPKLSANKKKKQQDDSTFQHGGLSRKSPEWPSRSSDCRLSTVCHSFDCLFPLPSDKVNE